MCGLNECPTACFCLINCHENMTFYKMIIYCSTSLLLHILWAETQFYQNLKTFKYIYKQHII